MHPHHKDLIARQTTCSWTGISKKGPQQQVTAWDARQRRHDLDGKRQFEVTKTRPVGPGHHSADDFRLDKRLAEGVNQTSYGPQAAAAINRVTVSDFE